MTISFSPGTIDEMTLIYGVDVRPQLEVGTLDQSHLHDFGRWARETHGQLYERIIDGPGEFKMQKRFVFAGKGEVEVTTFDASKRGPVFRFPLRLSAVSEDVEIPDAKEIFLSCLSAFREEFKTKKIVRVGQVRDMVFATGEESTRDWLAAKVPQFESQELDDVRLRLRYLREGMNIILELCPVVGQRITTDPLTGRQTRQNAGFGLRCKLDVNNSDMSRELGREEIEAVLAFADGFFQDELCSVLNGGAR